MKKRARERREELIEQEKKRKERFGNELKDSHTKFNEEHKDEIEIYNRYQQELQEKGNDNEGEDGNQEQPPVLPVFNEEEWKKQWLGENPEIQIPQPVQEEKDDDWYLTMEEEETFIAEYFKQKEGQQQQ